MIYFFLLKRFVFFNKDIRVAHAGETVELGSEEMETLEEMRKNQDTEEMVERRRVKEGDIYSSYLSYCFSEVVNSSVRVSCSSFSVGIGKWGGGGGGGGGALATLFWEKSFRDDSGS